MNPDNDQSYIVDITSDDPRKRTKGLEKIYDLHYVQVQQYIIKNRGTKEMAKDIMQDGIVALYYNLSKEKFQGKSSLGTYFFSICKNLWLTELKKHNFRTVDVTTIEHFYPAVDEQKPQIKLELLRSAMDKLKRDCRVLLDAFYYNKMSMKDIQQLFNLGSEQAAKTKKHRCIKYLMNVIDEMGLTFDSFQL